MKLRSLVLLFLLAAFSVNYAQERVVSLSPIVTKTIHMLHGDHLLVACTKWCPNSSDLPIVADAINVNIEALIKVKPDLVFASTLVSTESIKTIRSLNIDLIIIPRTTGFDQMCDNVSLIGQKLGMEVEAAQQVSIAKERLLGIQQNINALQAPRVMLQIGANPIFVAMSNTFVGDYIKQAGGLNCYEDLTHGTVTRESVLLRNPEAIFLSIMPSMSRQEIKIWASYSELLASKNKKIYALDQSKASAPTIHDFVDVVEIMVKELY